MIIAMYIRIDTLTLSDILYDSNLYKFNARVFLQLLH